MYTNNPKSIELAGWGLACEWWEGDNLRGFDRKYCMLEEAVLELGKLELMGSIQKMIVQHRDIERPRKRNQIQNVDEVRRLAEPVANARTGELPTVNAIASGPMEQNAIDPGPGTIAPGTHSDAIRQVPATIDISRTQIQATVNRPKRGVPAIADGDRTEVYSKTDRARTEACVRGKGARSRLPVTITNEEPAKDSNNMIEIPLRVKVSSTVHRNRTEIPAIEDRVGAGASEHQVGNWDMERFDGTAGRSLESGAVANDISMQDEGDGDDLQTETSRLLGKRQLSWLPGETVQIEGRETSWLLEKTTGVVETPFSWLPDEVFESLTLPRETKGDRKRDSFKKPNSDMHEHERQTSCFEGATAAVPKIRVSTVFQEDVKNDPEEASGQSSADSGLFNIVEDLDSCSSVKSSSGSPPIVDGDRQDRLINWV